MRDPDLPKVIEFPVHRRGSLADTLRGLPDREDGPAWSGTRHEEPVSLLVADLRGHADVAVRLGRAEADGQIDAALAAAVEVLRSFESRRVAVGGGTTQPVVGAEFFGVGHALAAVSAAAALRDAVERAADGIRVCAGVNSGSVVDTSVEGATPVAYRAMGTLRMLAIRLQEFAGPGQVFVSAATMAGVPAGAARFRSIGPIRTNAGGETSAAYSLLELLSRAGSVRPRATGSA
jgi:class 3 adenylate cyclase